MEFGMENMKSGMDNMKSGMENMKWEMIKRSFIVVITMVCCWSIQAHEMAGPRFELTMMDNPDSVVVPDNGGGASDGRISRSGVRIGKREGGGRRPGGKIPPFARRGGDQTSSTERDNGDSKRAQSIGDGSWKGTLKAGQQELTMVLHIDMAAREVKMDVIEQGAMGIALTVNHLSEDSLNVSYPQLGMVYAGKYHDGQIKGTFMQRLFMTALNLEPGEVVYRRPQTPQPPYPYITEEVTFENPAAQATLAGTLTYPVGYQKGKKVPVVLMVTGSGAQNRDEEVFLHKPFLVIADYLARHGIASLRYDDRGYGQSTGDFSQATTMDFARDAACGLAYLRGLKRFSRVGLLGHSEGGAIGYILGSEKKCDFVVSLAGPAGRIDSMMVLQLNGLAKAQGASGLVVKDCQGARQYMLKTGDTPWMKYFVDMDLTPYVRKTRCPVLALGGENDLNVPVVFNTPQLEANLPKSKKKKNKVKVYPGLNHFFQHGSPTDVVNIEETISEEVLADIVEWIR